VRNAAGSLYGLAYGDALGKPTEFQEYATIVATYGPGGPRELTGSPALVTDDTQMALAVGESLLAAPAITAEALEPLLRAAFVDWSVSPDNNRAPGMTCLRACAALADGRPWQRASEIGSKGCGANMRVTPVGLVPGLSDEQRAGVAQLQAGLTHGHPTGLAASELTAYACNWLGGGLAPADLLDALRDRCRRQRLVYRDEWLGDLWKRSDAASPEEFIALGWDECLAALDRVAVALAAADFAGDPCLAGAFAGAALGLAAWPDAWRERIEYTDRLARLAAAWD
jgi:ADP-ribosylglycohydrolase